MFSFSIVSVFSSFLLLLILPMVKILGNRNIVLAKEITKIHETFYRNTLENLINDMNFSLSAT